MALKITIKSLWLAVLLVFSFYMSGAVYVDQINEVRKDYHITYGSFIYKFSFRKTLFLKILFF